MATTILYLTAYFLAGVLQDFLLTLNWRFVASEKIIPASFFSFVVTVVSMIVLYNILTDLDGQNSVLAIVVYSFGIATGTFFGMKIDIGKNKQKIA
ncbi:MAG: DUF5698 domain-containing protein [Candidatus Paceibacterota bacterium]|jgi:uncharacterized protein YebE (UPF0316 family)